MKKTITIATRESPLALAQANWVKTRLEKFHPRLVVRLLGLTTEADRSLSVTLAKIGGKGLFVKELEEALLDGRADIAVHSMKDVPAELPNGLRLPVVCERVDAFDVLVSDRYKTLKQLPKGCVVGTSSLRRQSQLYALRPDLKIEPLRGNVNTRLTRLDEKKYDALILAAAGLKRLQMTDRIQSYLSANELLPAAGQGALGIECRDNDSTVQELIMPLHHKNTFLSVMAERAVTRHLGGGCSAPVAAYAEIVNKKINCRGLVGMPDGSTILSVRQVGSLDQAETIGKQVAEVLLLQGAKKILESACKI